MVPGHRTYAKINGETARVDTEVADNFPEQLKKVLAKSVYTLEQEYNVKKTEHFWKRKPARIFFSREGKINKSPLSRLTHFSRKNAIGDTNLKPYLNTTSKAYGLSSFT